MPPPGSPTYRQLQDHNGSLHSRVEELETELKAKCRQMAGLYTLNHALKQRITVLEGQLRQTELDLRLAQSHQVPRVTSDTRPKRALPVGILPADPEEKTKKMKAEPPRPSCVPRPTQRR